MKLLLTLGGHSSFLAKLRLSFSWNEYAFPWINNDDQDTHGSMQPWKLASQSLMNIWGSAHLSLYYIFGEW